MRFPMFIHEAKNSALENFSYHRSKSKQERKTLWLMNVKDNGIRACFYKTMAKMKQKPTKWEKMQVSDYISLTIAERRVKMMMKKKKQQQKKKKLMYTWDEFVSSQNEVIYIRFSEALAHRLYQALFSASLIFRMIKFQKVLYIERKHVHSKCVEQQYLR